MVTANEIDLLNEKNMRELESLLMVMNGIIKELEYVVRSAMDKKSKYSKSLILLEEIRDYSSKTKRLLNKSIDKGGD